MSFKYETLVTSCRKCPYSSNNHQEHDDPFTGPSLRIRWYCNQGENTRKNVCIEDELEIANDCPLNLEAV
jgi:hypothetical protein